MQPVGFTYRPGLPHMPTRNLNISLFVSTATKEEGIQGFEMALTKPEIITIRDFWNLEFTLNLKMSSTDSLLISLRSGDDQQTYETASEWSGKELDIF